MENCKECLEGYYGTSCLPCPNCNHGVCLDRQVGNGTCVCDTGFTEASNCTDCSNGYYGETCQECPFCNNHGTCNDGKMGDGSCKCDEGFDSTLFCSNCLPGHYGEDCLKTCPGNSNCDGHGVCDDGVDGTGRCTCHEGYVGIYCNTLYENDKCNPHCFTGYGACDEGTLLMGVSLLEKGVCICWDGHLGIDCNYNRYEVINLYVLLVFIILISVISFVFMYSFSFCFMYSLRVKVLSRKGKKKTVEKRMIVDPEKRSISWRAKAPTSKKLVKYDTLHEDEEY